MQPKKLSALFVAIALAAAGSPAWALPMHPALAPAGTAVNATKQLGNWGEEFVSQTLKMRGFGVEDMQRGGKGIDLIAFKRDANGQLSDVRIVDAKTRTAGALTEMDDTTDGPQLSRQWIKARLQAIADDPEDARGPLAREVLSKMETDPDLVKVEAHFVGVRADSYVVRAVEADGSLGGELSSQRLSSTLETLAEKAESADAQKWAAQHLAKLDQLKAGAGDAAQGAQSAAPLTEPTAQTAPAATSATVTDGTTDAAATTATATIDSTVASDATAAAADGAAADASAAVAVDATSAAVADGAVASTVGAAEAGGAAGAVGGPVGFVAGTAVGLALVPAMTLARHGVLNEVRYGQVDSVKPVTGNDLRGLVNRKYLRPLPMRRYTGTHRRPG